MNENLKTTLIQKLDGMTDETGRQLLDYIEYLESKFNRSDRERSTLERIAENVEGTLRSSKIGEAAVKGTGGIIDAAGNVARSVAAAGQAVIDELQQVVNEDADKDEDATKHEAASEGGAGGDETGREATESDASDVSEDDRPEDKTGGDDKSA